MATVRVVAVTVLAAAVVVVAVVRRPGIRPDTWPGVVHSSRSPQQPVRPDYSRHSGPTPSPVASHRSHPESLRRLIFCPTRHPWNLLRTSYPWYHSSDSADSVLLVLLSDPGPGRDN